MDLFKHLETALQTTAAQVVEGNLLAAEFPAGRAPTGPPRAPLSAGAIAAVAGNAVEAWTMFCLDGHKAALRRGVDELQKGPNSAEGRQALEEVLELAAALVALPDPAHALEAAVVAAKHSAELESEVRHLQRDLKSARADDQEVQELVAAHEREKAAGARLRSELEEAQAELEALRAAAGSSTVTEVQLRAKEEEAEQLQAALAKLRAEYDASQTQLFDALAAQEAAAGTVQGAEDVAAMDELDRLRRQVAGLSAQRAQLQQQVTALQEQQRHAEAQAAPADQQQQPESQHGEGQQQWGGGRGEGGERGDGAAAGGGLGGHVHGALAPQGSLLGAARDAERQQARAELEGALARLREAEHQARLLESRAGIAEAQAARLQAEVARRPAPEQHAEAAAAVAALSALLGKQLEEEGWEAGAAQAAVTALSSDPSQLQSQLQERVRKLSDALAAAERRAEASQAERDAAARQAEAARAEAAEARELAQQLEADLAVAAACGGGGGGGAGPAAGGDAGGAAGEAADLAAVIAEGAPPEAGGTQAGVGAAGVGAAAGGGNLLGVVVRQRDRLAARVAALEDGGGQLAARAAALQGSVDKLTADNVELVKQIRYLKQRQLAAGIAAGAGGGAPGEPRATVIRVDSAGVAQQDAKAARYSCGPLAFEVASRRRRQQAGPGGLDAAQQAGHGGAEAKYAAQYERSVNPFADFQKAEVEGRVRALKLHDRVMFAAGSLVAGSPVARAALFAYLLLLHVVVMAATYSRALSSAHCATKT